jgi:hypothetical protein
VRQFVWTSLCPSFVLITDVVSIHLFCNYSAPNLLSITKRSYFTTDSQYVLVSSTLVGLTTRYYFLSECCCLVSVGRPLWREDGSPIYSVMTQWSGSLRTRNHILLSHLRLSQPGGPGSRIYIPQEQGDPVIPPGTGFVNNGRVAWLIHTWVFRLDTRRLQLLWLQHLGARLTCDPQCGNPTFHHMTNSATF